MKKNIKDMNIEELNIVLAAIAAKEAKGKALTALEAFQKDIIPALIDQKTKVAALQTRTKSSTKREATVPTAYNILQPLFVTIRGNVNEKIVENSVLVDLFNLTAKKLNITIDKAMSEKLVLKTIYHNSYSNIGDKKKNDNKVSCDNRVVAFKAMMDQAKVLLPLLDKTFCDKCIKEVTDNACYK